MITTLDRSKDTSPDPSDTNNSRAVTVADADESKNLTADARRIIDAAGAVLAQGEALLNSVTPEAYARKNDVAFNASIGGHYRHCLDHFNCVLRGLQKPEINYDHRERNVRVETDPEFALKITRQLHEALKQLSPEMLATPVMACCEVSYDKGQSPRACSSYSRELVYAIAHAIHHYALISIMARLMEIKLPQNFGIAPSTVAHQAAASQSK
jgi:hypothetical protein